MYFLQNQRMKKHIFASDHNRAKNSKDLLQTIWIEMQKQLFCKKVVPKFQEYFINSYLKSFI